MFLQIVKEIRHFVGLLCDGFEEELLALFAATEASNSEQGSGSCSNLGKKVIKELRRFSCSINYDAVVVCIGGGLQVIFNEA